MNTAELWQVMAGPPVLEGDICTACGQQVPVHPASYGKLTFRLSDGRSINIPVLMSPEGRAQAERFISILRLKVSI